MIERMSRAIRSIESAYDEFGDALVMSTSFGTQSSVLLHLATRVVPRIPVIWVDTGYLPPETYRHAEALTAMLGLNLHVYQSPITPARMEAIHGRLWETADPDQLDRYDAIRKVEPMQRALSDLAARAWLSGVRRDQTDHRRHLTDRTDQWGVTKLHPLLHWSAADIEIYRCEHLLPRHPLEREGFRTVGDWHSSRPMDGRDTHERATRFRGLKQECGLHRATPSGARIGVGRLGLA